MPLDNPARVAAKLAGNVREAGKVGRTALAARRGQIQRPFKAEKRFLSHRVMPFCCCGSRRRFCDANTGALPMQKQWRGLSKFLRGLTECCIGGKREPMSRFS
jgi:hypothetical protein